MISVIIPTYNEESHIRATLKALREHDGAHLIKEIILADGKSSDNTVAVAQSEKVKTIVCPQKGRAAQMNYGTLFATGHILYFLHADTIPPPNFTNDITKAVASGFQAGCYRLAFDYRHWFLEANCWFTRFSANVFRFGDQSLFLTKAKFNEVGGFSEKHLVMEDQDIILRLKKICAFKVLNRSVITSARKYLENGIYRTQSIFFLIYIMYRLGFSQPKLIHTYVRLIQQDKY